MKAVRIHSFGGPDVLSYDEVPLAEPSAEQVQVKIEEAVGVNYVDIVLRAGWFPVQFPASVGQEAASMVEAVGYTAMARNY